MLVLENTRPRPTVHMSSRGRTPFVPAGKAAGATVTAPSPSQSQFTALDVSTAFPAKPPAAPVPPPAADAAASGLLELAATAIQPASAPVGGSTPAFPNPSAAAVALAPTQTAGPISRFHADHSPIAHPSHLLHQSHAISQPHSLPNHHTDNHNRRQHQHLDSAPPHASSAVPGALCSIAGQPTTPAIAPIPTSLPAASFGILGAADDEHVTVWQPATGKTVAGNAAPYRRNLQSWLASHEGWEEKADELKSSKRRSAARRARSASTSFKSLCHYPVAHILVLHASAEIDKANRHKLATSRSEGTPAPAPHAPVSSAHPPSAEQSANAANAAAIDWTNEDYVRLQEALFSLAQGVHISGGQIQNVPRDAWEDVASAVGPAYSCIDVMVVARHLLHCGIRKAAHSQMAHAEKARAEVHYAASGVGPKSLPKSSPLSIPATARGGSSEDVILPSSFSAVQAPAGQSPLDSGTTAILSGSYGHPSSMPNLDSATHFLDRSFRSPREPRITVWEPTTGRTVSGNAAPCRKNLDTWLAQHPGWVAKGEDQLSSSRRSRKTPPSAVPSRPTVPPPYGVGASGSAPTAGFPSPAPSALTPSATPRDSPVFNDALEGLLGLQSGGNSGVTPGPSGGEAVAGAQSSHAVSLERPNPPQFTSSVSSGSSRCTRDDQMQDTDVVDEDVANCADGGVADDEMRDEGGDVDMGEA